MTHPTTELIAYVTESLPAEERTGIEAHLATCADCRRERDGFAAVLADLRRSVPTAPEPNWGRWQAELRARVEARAGRARWRRPVPAMLSAALAAGLVATVWLGYARQAPRPELAAIEEVAVGERLEFVRDYPVLERLDLLEDLELIHDLDRLAARGEG